MNADELTSTASVVVIGGGIMGCSTLYHLAKMGVRDAVLVERKQLIHSVIPAVTLPSL